jgi:hypothetical protein
VVMQKSSTVPVSERRGGSGHRRGRCRVLGAGTGRRIGLMIVSTDHDYTLRPTPIASAR